MCKSVVIVSLLLSSAVQAQLQNTLPALNGDRAPQNFLEMWAGFDPQSEPLETEVLKEWEEDGVMLRIVRFRIGVFKNQKSTLAAIYGFPKLESKRGQKIPGLVQIHGGGQYADHKACLMNAKRGYATVSIAWAGRISSPQYRLGPAEVKLFWNGKTDDPNYRVTTDWGAVDGYHAPGRHSTTVFPSAKPTPWTIDDIESPRNSPWFLCAMAARRALTFLENQPEVDVNKLGVYGHSMGGKLTVLSSVDSRVKAAAPSCGGISDRDNASDLFEKTIGDDVSLAEISCPIIFLSPANDFHGRIGDLPRAINEIKSDQWRVTCSPHGSHQDLPEYEVATLLWFDQHLKGEFKFPKTPDTELMLKTQTGVPVISINPDSSRQPISIDVFYTQHGKDEELSSDRLNTKSRFWRYAEAVKEGEDWTAKLPLTTSEKPLWVYANVIYALDEPVTGAGYYYGLYSTDRYNVSSLLEKVSPDQLQAAGVQANVESTLLIESFEEGWEKEWFTYKLDQWPRATHKVYDEQWHAPENAKLVLEVLSQEKNQLVVLIDGHAAEVELDQPGRWQEIALDAENFRNAENDPLPNWHNIGELKLSDVERLRPARGSSAQTKIAGRPWKGSEPEFRNLRWRPIAAPE